jgi:hypothetical protein
MGTDEALYGASVTLLLVWVAAAKPQNNVTKLVAGDARNMAVISRTT